MQFAAVGRASPLAAAGRKRGVWINRDGAHGVTRPTITLLASPYPGV